jgi:hypothetical protein
MNYLNEIDKLTNKLKYFNYSNRTIEIKTTERYIQVSKQTLNNIKLNL